MERDNLAGLIGIKTRMVTIGFTEKQSKDLIDTGFIAGPKDVSLVTRREMLGAGFSRSEVRKIEAEFTPEDLRF